jgi:hypothetical protein
VLAFITEWNEIAHPFKWTPKIDAALEAAA